MLEDGEALYVGIRLHWGRNYRKFEDGAGKNDDRTRHITATLPAQAHLYDVCAHVYLGVSDLVDFDLTSSGAKFYALWPCALRAVTLAGTRARPGETVILMLY